LTAAPTIARRDPASIPDRKNRDGDGMDSVATERKR
jgi:hypothetical protein